MYWIIFFLNGDFFYKNFRYLIVLYNLIDTMVEQRFVLTF